MKALLLKDFYVLRKSDVGLLAIIVLAMER